MSNPLNIRQQHLKPDRVLYTAPSPYLHTVATRSQWLVLAISAPGLRDGGAGDSEAATLLQLVAAKKRLAQARERAADRVCDRCRLSGVTESVTSTGAQVPRRYGLSRNGGRVVKSGLPANGTHEKTQSIEWLLGHREWNWLGGEVDLCSARSLAIGSENPVNGAITLKMRHLNLESSLGGQRQLRCNRSNKVMPRLS